MSLIRNYSRHNSLIFAFSLSLFMCPVSKLNAQSDNKISQVPKNSGLPEIVVPMENEKNKNNDATSINSKKKNKNDTKRNVSSEKSTPGDETEKKGKGSDLSIVVLVNDEPITGYEITQRQRLMTMGNPNIGQKAQANFKAIIQSPSTTEALKNILNKTIKENPGKSRDEIIPIFEQRKKEFAQKLQEQAIESARKSVIPNLRKDAVNELIEERLKLQEAKKLDVLIKDEDVNKFMQTLAEKNKMSDKDFSEYLKKTGTDINVLKARFKANMSWQEVIRRRYGAQISISEREVDRYVENSPDATDKNIELLLHRIILPISAKIDQKELTAQMSKAEALIQKGGGCALMSTHAASLSGAKFENLGQRLSDNIPEPTRTLLVNSKDGELLPPIITKDGIEIWAACSRKNVSHSDEKRQNAQAELRQKEFEVLAKKHLNDLRQDAAIEYR